jgi:hypothetical protein
LDETTSCKEATETEHIPGMMQSIEEQQEIPKEDAAVMPAGGPRKRRRVCNLAAEGHQKMKERFQGYRGYRRKLAAAVQKWHRKRNLFRNVQTQGKCVSRKELPAGRITTRCAKVARHKDRRSNKDDGRSRLGINLQVEPENDGHSVRDVGWIRKAALV